MSLKDTPAYKTAQANAALRLKRATTGKPGAFHLRRGVGCVVVSRDASKPGKWRSTRIDEFGNPTGHVEANSLLEALRYAQQDGADLTQEI